MSVRACSVLSRKPFVAELQAISLRQVSGVTGVTGALGDGQSDIRGVMENKAGEQGLDLRMLAVFVATLEHLIHGDQRERLKQAWLVHELRPEGSTTGEGLLSVLEVFMAHYVYVSQKVDSGYALTLPKALEEVNTISRIYGGWPQIRSFIHDQVEKALLKKSSLTFDDAAEAADAVLLLFQEVSGAMCHDMERTFQTLRGGDRGLVRLSELRTADGGDLFRESVDYLRQLGALDETGRDAYVFMPNYMLGPSNCDGTTSFYDLCCPNSCEAYKGKLEQALMSAADHVDAVLRTIEDHSGSKLQDELLTKLKAMAKEQGDQVLIHGHAFADWLHQAFPRECPRPRAADFQGRAGAIPDAKTEFQATTALKADLFEW
ncbi:licD [Symbiodinium natans]|uniref:LicD protein n=1 Tax=Symbiodinium natans TaxID=878477 RepID=A0A812TGR6_9DINO|nr:licD [Symbiodinium natans]